MFQKWNVTLQQRSLGGSGAMTKLPISVCMISGAEAKRIDRALSSISGWVSEIIVVLNEEIHDGTEEIALQHGARVFRESWKGHIEQKNSALAKATQAWLLGLDADEAVSDALRDEIERNFGEPSLLACYAALRFPRLTSFCGRWIRHGDWYPDYSVRLWRKGAAQWGGVNPHDKLVVRGRIRTLRGDLLHYSNPTISNYVQKINYFADAYLKWQIETGVRWSAPAAIFRAGWRFLRGYFLRLGFLDGFPGFFIAASTAYSTLVRHSRLFEHLRQTEQAKCAPTPSR
jgi:glycosyltransferase involved in cell wall biosynthesis